MLGFQPVTIRQIIDSITDRYLKFNETQKEELEKQLEKQHDWGPIDTHIAMFNKVFKAFETAGEPFTNKQKVSKFYRSVRRFSLAKKACEDWDDRPEAERTWANMQSDFRDWCDKKMANTTTEAAGYHGANLASSASDDPFLSRADLLLADATEALKTNQAMMANLAKKSNEKDDTIANLRQETASLKAMLVAVEATAAVASRTAPATSQAKVLTSTARRSGNCSRSSPEAIIATRAAIRPTTPALNALAKGPTTLITPPSTILAVVARVVTEREGRWMLISIK